MPSPRPWWLLVALPLAGCRTSGFHCSNDGQCALEGEPGQCHAGYCTFPDTECDSGQRYGAHAGPSSGQCLVVDAATSDASTTAVEQGSTAGTTTTEATSDPIRPLDESTQETSGCMDPQCGCPDGIWCEGVCVDPQTDPAFCGASNDCEGADRGQTCTPSAACIAGACLDSCVNCGFEAGDFTGWTPIDLDDPYVALEVVSGSRMDPGRLFMVTSTEGEFFAVTGFDGDGPGTIELGQDLTLAAEPPADLVFDYRAGWDLLTYGAAVDRIFDVQIEPAGGGPPLEVVEILVAPAGDMTLDTGVLEGMIDLGAYAGQTVFVRFVFTVPESNSGPALALVDHVRVEPQ